MRTFYFNNKPVIYETASIGGPKEVNGGIGGYFDIKMNDDKFGETSFEKAEAKMMYEVIKKLMEKSKISQEEINAIISGDLLNQIISSTFSARNFNCGYLGVYNACATFTESLILGGSLIGGGFFQNVICGTSSHFSSAERQYRFPLELGSIRPPLSQWTVTGAGVCHLKGGNGNSGEIVLTSATIGKIVDYGVIDVNNMGAAMAPSACDTLITHFNETGRNPSYYDLIISGDLGTLGSRILKDLTWDKGYNIEDQHVDCGELIYNLNETEYQGGSGAGCSSLVFSSYIFDKLRKNKIKKILLMSTGALLSSVSSQQGESIPGVSHAVSIEVL